MERVNTGRSVLEVAVEGDGEPVLLLHGSIMGETYRAMMREPALAGRYKLISVLRQGFAGSSHSEGPYSIVEQAADALAVLHAMGEERAHVVGHSYGGVIALQLAFDAPGSVHSLALLEPALLMVPAAGAFSEAMVPANEAYTAGDPRAAIDAFMRAACGDNYLEVSDATVGPGCYWRGPVWQHMNMLIATGFRDRGHAALALAIRNQSERLFSASGFHEYYDPLSGAGLGGKNFSWTAATYLHWIAD